MADSEQLIRERAYQLWMAEGCPEGRADFHWHVAREQVLASLRAPASRAASKPRKQRVPAAPRTSRPRRAAKDQAAAQTHA
jgi:hypothetical protein